MSPQAPKNFLELELSLKNKHLVNLIIPRSRWFGTIGPLQLGTLS